MMSLMYGVALEDWYGVAILEDWYGVAVAGMVWQYWKTGIWLWYWKTGTLAGANVLMQFFKFT